MGKIDSFIAKNKSKPVNVNVQVQVSRDIKEQIDYIARTNDIKSNEMLGILLDVNEIQETYKKIKSEENSSKNGEKSWVKLKQKSNHITERQRT